MNTCQRICFFSFYFGILGNHNSTEGGHGNILDGATKVDVSIYHHKMDSHIKYISLVANNISRLVPYFLFELSQN